MFKRSSPTARSETDMCMKKNSCGNNARRYDMGKDKTIYLIANVRSPRTCVCACVHVCARVYVLAYGAGRIR